MLKKILATSGATVLLVGGLGFAAVQASTAPAKVKAVGVCAKVSGGALRLMEPSRLTRSQYGQCKKGEREVTIPTVHGVPKIPAPAAVIVYRRVDGTETCTKTADLVLTYACVTAPTPTPTPTPSATPAG